jgi:arginyl-tRNA synthetase
MSEADRQRTAEIIATAAERNFLFKFSRGKVIAFDISEALSFEGETGPYLQYAVVRANNIFAKLRERTGLTESGVIELLSGLNRAAIDAGVEGDELWDLVLTGARLDEIVDTAIRSLELSVLAKYAFSLAQAFNAFYHRQQILNEPDAATQAWRAAGVIYVRRQLTRALDLMGCAVPMRM